MLHFSHTEINIGAREALGIVVRAPTRRFQVVCPSIISLIILLLVPLSDALTNATSDERTLLDTFGESAKEFLTQKVIPQTSSNCYWDWRHVRCEPYCSCHFKIKWGDYHLGRACRTREDVTEVTYCEIPPDALYAKILNVTISKSLLLGNAVRTKSQVTLQKTGERISQIQYDVCENIPESCFSGERNWKEKLLCGHIPTCEEEPTQEDFDNTKMIDFSKGKWSWK